MTYDHYLAGREFERHQLKQRLRIRLAELDRLIANGADGRAAIIAAAIIATEIRRIVDSLNTP